MSNYLIVFVFLIIGVCETPSNADLNLVDIPVKIEDSDTLPKEVSVLMKYYSDIVDYKNGKLIFSNGFTLLFNDSTEKSIEELLNKPDIQDMFTWKYNTTGDFPINKEDAGRIRNEDFFKAIYGNSKEKVRSNLKPFVWCPKLVNQTILFSTKNGAFDALKRVSDELDQHPEWKEFIKDIGGTFNWRKISGTERLSAHAYGITIDINTKFSNYWQWDCGCKNENVELGYKNKIPIALVKIFEKNGFVWGGKWYHYDTMHFEYRPELF
jgi:hypothetical protein